MRLLITYVNKNFKNDKMLVKVRDRCHYDRKYRGEAHFRST